MIEIGRFELAQSTCIWEVDPEERFSRVRTYIKERRSHGKEYIRELLIERLVFEKHYTDNIFGGDARYAFSEQCRLISPSRSEIKDWVYAKNY